MDKDYLNRNGSLEIDLSIYDKRVVYLVNNFGLIGYLFRRKGCWVYILYYL